jgi:hypothetical protein
VKVHIRPVKKFSVIETRQHNGQECLDSYRQFINGEGDDYHRISFDGCLAEARRRYLAEIGLL